MKLLTDIKLPEHGLMLLFVPTSGDSYRAEMMYTPPENADIEEIKFYVALGQGLMQLAHTSTQDVIDIGVEAVNASARPDTESDPDGIIDQIMDDTPTVH